MDIKTHYGLNYQVIYNPMNRRNELRLLGFHSVSLNNLKIPETVDGIPVTCVDKYAFSKNTSIQTVEYPDSLEYFEDRCFSGCTNLKKVFSYKTNNTAKELVIFHQVFAKCKKLETFQSQAPVSVFYEAFWDCENLKNVLASIKGVGTRAFHNSPTQRLQFEDDALWCKDSLTGLKNLKEICFLGTISLKTCKTYLKDVKKKYLTLYVNPDRFNYLDWVYEGINIIVQTTYN